jgi:redox-sensitive bicupin YhaK (pirin superfamily)
MSETSKLREIEKVIEPLYVMEGAGVKLRRSIATRSLDYLDPFLLFDHFGSHNPDDYMRGFPLHPHRGIETVTYMLAGKVRHADSLGNKGEIVAGDVQWMTSGRGIMHEEMPQGIGNHMEGFQLWVNLPARLKMSAPRYQEIKESKIPWLNPTKGVTIRLIAGRVGDVAGPVTEIAADPLYMDVTVDPGDIFEYDIPSDHTAFAYVFKGGGDYCGTMVEATKMVVFAAGDHINIKGGLLGTRFLLVAGKPLGEPIARYGPFVMNTSAEIEQTLREIRNGTFAKE